jgi:hypothetical protein
MNPGWSKKLEDSVALCRMGEAEVARSFFAAPRPLTQHITWLKFQVTRELRNLREISEHHLCNLVDQVEAGISRENMVERLMEDYQEVRHYSMLAYLLESISGEKVSWRELNTESLTADWYAPEWPERVKAEEMSEPSALDRAAVAFNRASSGSLFLGLIGLTGGNYESLLSEASKIVLHDELEHGASEGRDLLYPLINTEAELEHSISVIKAFASVRLRVRNVQFGNVLSESRLQEIQNGNIDPASLDVMEAACQDIITDHQWSSRFAEASIPLSSSSIS